VWNGKERILKLSWMGGGDRVGCFEEGKHCVWGGGRKGGAKTRESSRIWIIPFPFSNCSTNEKAVVFVKQKLHHLFPFLEFLAATATTASLIGGSLFRSNKGSPHRFCLPKVPYCWRHDRFTDRTVAFSVK
jgi:hypothetical protein